MITLIERKSAKKKESMKGVRTIATIAIAFLVNSFIPLIAAAPVLTASHTVSTGIATVFLSVL